MTVAIVHDYLTQRGGAERVVLAMQRAFPGAPVYTSLYDADTTFPEFRGTDIRTLGLNRIGLLRRNHRLALPLLASAMDGVVSPRTAGILGKLGGLGVLNLEGIYTRYEDAEEQLERISKLPPKLQDILQITQLITVTITASCFFLCNSAATCRQPTSAAPEEMPMSSPSSRATRRTMA